MGIDIGFTDDSLARSKYAHCAPFLNTVAALYIPPESNKPDRLAQYRDPHEWLNVKRLRVEDRKLYEQALGEFERMFPRDEMPWTEQTRGRISGAEVLARLQAYVEKRPDPWVRVEKLPEELRRQLISTVSEDDVLSAWYAMPYEDQIDKYCKGCPIRPPNEDNCSLRFSNYPGMDSFRQGFLMTLLYAATIKEAQLKEALFSFPHVDRKKGQLPKDKIQELYAIVQGTEVNKKPEEFFNQVADMVNAVKPADAFVKAQKLDLKHFPFVDEFISAYIYREKPYSPEDARKLLPYLETLREAADWAIWDANKPAMRHTLINFRNRMDTLVTALQFGDKYGLETYMSY